eukprot:297825_1
MNIRLIFIFAAIIFIGCDMSSPLQNQYNEEKKTIATDNNEYKQEINSSNASIGQVKPNSWTSEGIATNIPFFEILLDEKYEPPQPLSCDTISFMVPTAWIKEHMLDISDDIELLIHLYMIYDTYETNDTEKLKKYYW